MLKKPLNSKYLPGDRVVVGGEISATIEIVMFYREMERPIYKVEWWDTGDLKIHDFHEDDIKPCQRSAVKPSNIVA